MLKKLTGFLVLVGVVSGLAHGETWPDLPATNASAEIPAQEWEHASGPRTVMVYVYYPGGSHESMDEETGVMLTCHNWGGIIAWGAPDPVQIAERYNVVAIALDYLQSGTYDSSTQPPYDHGYLQALDALRALWWVMDGLEKTGVDYASDRVYATGGSGGGNVALMANKLAPRSFACVVAFSAMPRLTDDVAFGEDSGSTLNAGYSRDASHENYLSPAAQAIRDIGNEEHARQMKSMGNKAKMIIVHGANDVVCLTSGMDDVAKKLKGAGLDVQYERIDEERVKAEAVFKNTGHGIGDRTQMLFHLGDKYLKPGSAEPKRCVGPRDRDAKDAVKYSVPGGTWIIDYSNGYPVGRFE